MGCGDFFNSDTDFKLPGYVKRPSQALSVAAMRQLGKEYRPYKGDMVAGFTGSQQQALDWLRSMMPNEGKYLKTPRLIDAIPGTGDLKGTMQDYMDPYLEGVLNPALRDIRQQTAENLMADDARAQFAGGFRDTGHALERAEDKRLGAQAIGDTTARAYSDAFNTAMANRNLDLNRVMANRDASMQMADQLFGYGSKKQATNQAELSAKFNEYLRRQGWSLDQIQKIANIVASLQTGTPVTQPSMASTIGGGLLSGAGTLLDLFG